MFINTKQLTCEFDSSEIFEQFAAVDGNHLFAESPTAVTHCVVHISKWIKSEMIKSKIVNDASMFLFVLSLIIFAILKMCLCSNEQKQLNMK